MTVFTRHFRCDCGNKRFPDNPCKLQVEKDDYNSENEYNQNFSGLYCSCHRMYPDPEPSSDTSDDCMIQCIICEDWFHFKHCLSHLNMDQESLEDEDVELVCGLCMSKLDFLGHYSHLIVKPNPEKATVSDENAAASSENQQGAELLPVSPNVDVEKCNSVEDTCSKDSGIDAGTVANSEENGQCSLEKYPNKVGKFSEAHGVAWKGTLRSLLCRCSKCLTMYQNLKVQFLLDEEDTIEHYEALGKKNTEAAKLSAEASINSQMDKLGRVGQIEFFHGYNQFKEQLAEFLKSHAESGKVVQREDVNNFFAKVNEEQAAKRRRLD